MLKWDVKKLPIKELKEYEFNPRTIDKKDFLKLVKSIKEDGYHQRILVNTDYTIIGGHQRKRALLESGLKEDEEIEVLIPNKKLTQAELDRINIRDNLPFGKYDFDMLGNRFDLEELIEFGIPEEWLTGDVDELVEGGDGQLDEVINCNCNCHICTCECHEKKKKKRK